MKKQTFFIAALISMLTMFSSCEAIGAIFKTGMGVGIFLVIFVIIIIAVVVSKVGKGK